jgi:hypothetical protein
VLVPGIVVQPFLAAYQSAGVWNFNGSLGRVLFGLIIDVILSGNL